MPNTSITPCSFPDCGKATCMRGLCSGHLRQSKQSGRALTPIIRGRTSEQRFWGKVNKDGPTQTGMESPCWVWTGYRNEHGYGMFGIGDVWGRAHRHSFILENGPLPNLPGYHGACVLHRCDNPPCIRADHLFLGTHGENVADMRQKGRANHVRGERSGSARLTEMQVREMRALYAAGTLNGPSLAVRFGVAHSNVYAIIKRRTWSHLP